ncbi:MAG: DUF1302 family protein [Rhodocyclaceae bacterium]|nr:DUF1302 family protein [Rhodocyclaceae bacterium]
MQKISGRPRCGKLQKIAIAVSGCCFAIGAQAAKIDAGSDWDINLDNSVQYTAGWRAQGMDPKIGNHVAFAQGDYKFKDEGDMVTNRIQDLIEFQGVYKGKMGFRTSAAVWKDFAYNDDANQNPAFGGLMGNAYNGGTYSGHTKKYYLQGGEMLDYFLFLNTDIAETPVHLKVGRLSQYWGNAFFFGFSNIGFSQSPIDFQKGFSQPGTEVKELFMPRKQIAASVDITPELSVAAQWFFEFRGNRYPESATYLGFFDPLFDGPNSWAGMPNDGMIRPKDNNKNFGVKVAWSPSWANADMGFYYRQFDEVDPWLTLLTPAGHLQGRYAEGTKLFGFSLEKSFGLASMGLEINHRRNTALNSAPLQVTDEGARGNLSNVILNTFVQLGSNPIWDTGIFLAEFSYTRLHSVTKNASLYNGVGTANCVNPTTGGAGSWRDGCSTKNQLAFAMLFEPQWLQVFPSIDISTPISLTTGLTGNAAYRAGAFYAEGSQIYSVGVKATYQSKTSLTLQYNGYHWRTGDTANNAFGLPAYNGFGGNGAVSLNDRAWLQLTLKTSF